MFNLQFKGQPASCIPAALLIILTLGAFQAISAQAVTGGGGEAYPSLKTDSLSLERWKTMRFGLFIHWGPVSLRGTEIGWSRGQEVPASDYDSLYHEFDPVLLDAEQWVKMAKDAGMKYIVLVTKHHDGFCMWDTKFSDYSIMHSPFARDAVKELADECRRQGLMFCTYYSILDWHHPDYTTRHGNDKRPVDSTRMPIYITYMKNQLKELVEHDHTNLIWFDGEWEGSWTHTDGMDLYRYVRELDPHILINNRVDKGRSGMGGKTISSKYAGDYETPEQEIGSFNIESPWETCMTLCTQWSWKPNDKMKSLKECIQALAMAAGGGGNLLLNVGPMLDGRIEKRQSERLLEIGKWLKTNGESIYGTKGGPYKPYGNMVSTCKANNIYIHVFNWPGAKLMLPAFTGNTVKNIHILGGPALPYKTDGKKIEITLPSTAPDPNDTVIVIETNGIVIDIPPLNF